LVVLGQTFGENYIIEKHLGRGAFADVYLARHQHSQEMYAVKILSQEIRDHKLWLSLTLREAELWIFLGNLPGIVRASSIRQIDGRICIFIDYLQGGSLAERLYKGGKRELKFIVRTAMDVAAGLSTAWRRVGLVHGDLHPGNVLFAESEYSARVTDFALSAAAGFSSPEVAVSRKFVRNPLYLSPEQLTGARALDTRSDIYSFGIMLYELCFGLHPAIVALGAGATPAMIREWHVREKMVIAKANDLPSALAMVTERCLKREPSERFQDFEEIWDTLKEISDRHGCTSISKKYEDPIRRTAEDLLEQLTPILTNDLQQRYESLIALGAKERAVELLKKTIEHVPNEYAYWWNLGQDLAGLGRYDEAIHAFRSVLDLKPHSLGAQIRIGFCRQQQQMQRAALREYSVALEEFENSKKPEILLQDESIKEEVTFAYRKRGIISLDLELYALALHDFCCASMLCGVDPFPSLGKPVTTEAELSALIKQARLSEQPERDVIFAQIANAVLYTSALWSSSQLAISRTTPHAPELRWSLGCSLAKNGEYEQALDCFKELLFINSTDWAARARAGHCLLQLKRYEEAFCELTEYLAQAINRSAEDDADLVKVYCFRGQSCIFLGAYELAEHSFRQAAIHLGIENEIVNQADVTTTDALDELVGHITSDQRPEAVVMCELAVGSVAFFRYHRQQIATKTDLLGSYYALSIGSWMLNQDEEALAYMQSAGYVAPAHLKSHFEGLLADLHQKLQRRKERAT
jgi:serine/threonine protein kinase